MKKQIELDNHINMYELTKEAHLKKTSSIKDLLTYHSLKNIKRICFYSNKQKCSKKVEILFGEMEII